MKFKSMKDRLNHAALEGSMSTLRQLILEDPLIIDRVTLGFPCETPLHVAATLGHHEFAKEILRLKPELAKELDSRGSSPLHLASAKGQLEIVKSLLLIHPTMCLASDAEGRNPLHLAAMRGQIHVLRELIRASPLATWVRVDRGDTLLHLCVKSNQLETLKFLVENIADDAFVNAKDDCGFTILHLAVLEKQVQTIQYLLVNTEVEVNAKTSAGLTALDILTLSRRDMKDLDIAESLRAAGAVRTANNSDSIRRNRNPDTGSFTINSSLHDSSNRQPRISGGSSSSHVSEDWLTRKRDSLMVVAILIATMAFQSGTKPRGGFWQDDNPNPGGHEAGKSILAYKDSYRSNLYLAYNTAGLISSTSIVVLLVTGRPFKRKFFMWLLTVTVWLAILAMSFSYRVSILVFSPSSVASGVRSIVNLTVIIWSCLLSAILVAHGIRKMVQFFRKLNYSAKSKPRRRHLPVGR